MQNKWIVLLIISAGIFVLNSCKDNPVNPVKPVSAVKTDSAKVTISPGSTFGYVNGEVKFSVVVNHPDSSKQIKLIWSVNDTTIITINSTGLCRIKAKGDARIYAEIQALNGESLAKDTAFIHCDSLHFQFSEREVHLKSTQVYHLSFNYYPFKIKLASSDNSVATVDSMGVISPKGLGSAYISGVISDSTDHILARDSVKANVEWWKLYTFPTKISSMDYSPETNTIIIGTERGNGIYISRNDGNDWNQSNSGLILSSTGDVNSVTISRSNPNVIMGVTGWQYVVRSEDGGASWQNMQSPGQAIQNVAISPDNPDIVYALGRYINFQVYKSTDKGSSWTLLASLNDPSGAIPKIFIDPINSQNIFIGGHASYISTDGGVNWNVINWPNKGPDFILSNVDWFGNIYIQDYNWDGSLRLRLLRSTNNGSTWDILTEYSNSSYVYGTDYVTGSVLCNVAPEKYSISTNNGQTWTESDGIFVSPPSSRGIGLAVINTKPIEFIYALNTDFGGPEIWKYKKPD